jgi:hypothetical protein
MHINRHTEVQVASYNFRHSIGISNGTKLKKEKNTRNLNVFIFSIQLASGLITWSFQSISEHGNSVISCRPPGCTSSEPSSLSPFLVLLSSKRLASSTELSVEKYKEATF